MSDDEKEIRDLIERWAAAAHTGDMAGVLRQHADDIVMFDVPPPYAGVRGIDAYRSTWPGFFTWQASGSIYQIVELTVEAGGDLGFAWALLKCGKPADIGEQRLRVTFGLRRVDGHWVIAHEHHSFSDTTGDPAAEAEIRAVHERWSAATETKNLDEMMSSIAPDVVSYEHQPPLEYRGVEAVRESCREGLESGAGRFTFTVPEMTVRVAPDLAVMWGLNRMTHQDPEGSEVESWSRGTRVFERRDGEWTMIHQHVSFPV